MTTMEKASPLPGPLPSRLRRSDRRDPPETPQLVPVADDLAIPGYDSLAASQVVPRLMTLGIAELDAIGTYEQANRGRRTILNRVRQLQAAADGEG